MEGTGDTKKGDKSLIDPISLTGMPYLASVEKDMPSSLVT